MQEEIRTLILGVIDHPVAWRVLPSSAGLPRVSMFRVSGQRDMNVASLGLVNSRVQIDCYAETQAEAVVVSRVIRTALEGYSSGVIKGAFMDSVRDGSGEDAGLVPFVGFTFSIIHTE